MVSGQALDTPTGKQNHFLGQHEGSMFFAVSNFQISEGPILS